MQVMTLLSVVSLYSLLTMLEFTHALDGQSPKNYVNILEMECQMTRSPK